METIDQVVLDSIMVDNSGNVFFVAGEYYGDETMFAAYHFDKRTKDLNIIKGGVSYMDARVAIMNFREGIRV